MAIEGPSRHLLKNLAKCHNGTDASVYHQVLLVWMVALVLLACLDRRESLVFLVNLEEVFLESGDHLACLVWMVFLVAREREVLKVCLAHLEILPRVCLAPPVPRERRVREVSLVCLVVMVFLVSLEIKVSW